MHFVFGKINHGGLKHNSLYLGLGLPSGGGTNSSKLDHLKKVGNLLLKSACKVE